MWCTNTENLISISWVVSDCLPFNWKILAIAQAHLYSKKGPICTHVGRQLPKFLSWMAINLKPEYETYIFSRNIISCWYLKHFLASLSAVCYSILKIEEVPFLKIEKEQIDFYCFHSRGVGARWAGWARAHPLFSLPLLKRDTCTH